MDTDPQSLTLGAAARACNRSKATLSRAVRSGRLPAKAAADNSGGWQIRLEDLNRVFPPLQQIPDETVAEPSRPPRDEDEIRREVERLRVEVEGLRERSAGLQRRIDGLEADKADLRAERDRLLGVIETQATRQLDARRGWWPWRRR